MQPIQSQGYLVIASSRWETSWKILIRYHEIISTFTSVSQKSPERESIHYMKQIPSSSFIFSFLSLVLLFVLSVYPSIHHLIFIHLSHSQLCSFLIQTSTQISQTELTESFGKKATTFSTIFYFSFLSFSLSFSFSSPSSSSVMTCPFKYKSKYYFTYIIQIWKKIWRRQNHP